MAALISLVKVVIVIFVAHVDLGNADGTYFGNEVKDTRRVGSNTTEVRKPTVSTIECAAECSRDVSCDALAYNERGKLCHKYSIVHDDPGKLEIADGWVYFEKTLFRDCSELYKTGTRKSGVYNIAPSDGLGKMKVYCDMATDGGGWTVIQRRQDGSVDFFRNWNDYKTGFGNMVTEFWLGNENIHRLTRQTGYVLRVHLEDFEGNKAKASYKKFFVASETLNYVLTIDQYFGDAGDSMTFHDAEQFSTKDRDNDQLTDGSCSNYHKGGWWYKHYVCVKSNLNGEYGKSKGYGGIFWDEFKGYTSLKRASMMIRPVNFTSTQ